jgi:hypothetical protein
MKDIERQILYDQHERQLRKAVIHSYYIGVIIGTVLGFGITTLLYSVVVITKL